MMLVNIRNRRKPLSTLFAVEAGRSIHGRWFAYVNINDRNYWLRRY